MCVGSLHTLPMAIDISRHLLELFFEEHSHLANIHEIFSQSMEETFDQEDIRISYPKSSIVIENLIAEKSSYNAKITIGEQSFLVPWMTPNGTFIINGVEKVPLIQEVKARHVIYVSPIIKSAVIATTRFPNTKFPVRLVFKATEMYLDVSMISRQLAEDDDDDDDGVPSNDDITTKIPFEVLIAIFNSNINHVVAVLESMEESATTLSLLLASLKPNDARNIPNKEKLVENIFGLFVDDDEIVDDIVINTLLYMLNECVLVYFGKKEPSDRNDYSNKLLKSSGDIIAPILSDAISRKSTNYTKILEAKLMPMMRTGVITVGSKTYSKMVVQVSKRSSFDIFSSIRKIAIPCDENSAGVEMRRAHPSQRGFICLSETPEGKTTGLIKSLALTCVLSPKMESTKIFRKILRWMKLQRNQTLEEESGESSETKMPIFTRKSLILHQSPISKRRYSLHKTREVDEIPMDEDAKYFDANKFFRVWIIFDGIVLGYFFNTIDGKVYEEFRDKMKKKYQYISISNPSKFVVEVRTWSGRIMKPLLKSPVNLKKLQKCKSWESLMEKGFVEYLDPSEKNTMEKDISETLDGEGKYAEIHPCTLFGIPASLIPFANHNQTARNVFASSMIKQAMQLVESPSLYHEGKYLVYGQKPLVNTITSDIFGLNENPNGINLIVCVLSYTGYNMEDAIIVNKNSVDNGLFLSMVRNVYNIAIDGDIVYDNDEVLLLEGELEKKISKIKLPERQTNFNGVQITRPSVVDSPMEDVEGRFFMKHDEYRELSIGDKMASRNAQKGVVGRIMPAEDMPFTEDGIKPDIIFNPHGIPSRMTMGQLLEGVIGTQCAINGTFFDGTSFNPNLDIDEILEMEIKNSGLLYSGISGEVMEEFHSLGTIYYMPLKHQAKDKVYIRWVGPNELFSRQPVAGKKKGGGLKFGEMEMDSLVSHGAANSAMDTLRQSDMCDIPICKGCGLTPMAEKVCPVCKMEDVVDVEMPYSFKVFSDLAKCTNMLTQVELE